MKLIILLLIVSCSNSKKFILTPKKNNETKSQAKKLKLGDDELVLISYSSLQHSSDNYSTIFSNSKNEETEIKYGGLNNLYHYLNIVKKVYPDNSIILNSGNNFKGLTQNTPEEKVKYYNILNQLNTDAFLFTNLDFYFNTSNELEKFIDRANLPFVSSNLIEIKSKRHFKIKKLNPRLFISKKNSKVVVFGLSNKENLNDKNIQSLNGLYLEDYIDSLTKQFYRLRRKKIDAYIVLSHFRESCIDNHECQIKKIIDQLPPQSIQIFINGGTERNHFFDYKGVKIIEHSQRPDSLYLSRIKLNKNNKAIISQVSEIKLCEEFISDLSTCFSENKKVEKIEKKPALFLGETIPRHEELKLNHLDKIYNQKIAKLYENLNHSKHQINNLSRLFSDSIMYFFKTDFSLLKNDQLRGSLYFGDISYSDLKRVSRPNLKFVALKVKGDTLKKILNIAVSYYPVSIDYFSGAKLILKNSEEIDFLDLNQNDMLDIFEKQKIKNVFINEKELNPSLEYKLVVDEDFFFNGKNSLKKLFNISDYQFIQEHTFFEILTNYFNFLQGAYKSINDKNSPYHHTKNDEFISLEKKNNEN